MIGRLWHNGTLVLTLIRWIRSVNIRRATLLTATKRRVPSTPPTHRWQHDKDIVIVLRIPALFCSHNCYLLPPCLIGKAIHQVAINIWALPICYQILRKGPCICESTSQGSTCRTSTTGIIILQKISIERTLTNIFHELFYQAYISRSSRLKRSINPEDQIDMGNAIYYMTTIVGEISNMIRVRGINTWRRVLHRPINDVATLLTQIGK